MKILGTLIEELNKQPEVQEKGGFKRLHSPQYEIVTVRGVGNIRRPVNGNKPSPTTTPNGERTEE